MKLFAIKIKDSVNHVMCFDDEKQYEKTFVIENNAANPVLLKLPKGYPKVCGKSSFSVLTDKGTMNVVIASVNVTEKSEEKNLIQRKLEFHLIGKNFRDHEVTTEELGKADGVVLNACQGGTVGSGFNPVRGDFTASLKNGATAVSYEVTFKLTTVDKTAITSEESCSCLIVLSPASMIFNATLDFGSEASQILEFRQNAPNIGPDNRKRLFREMAALFKHQDDIDLNNHLSDKNRSYIQFDIDDQLFRSHFFVSKKVKGSDSFDSCKPSDNVHIKMFINDDEVDNDTFKMNHITLPNVKIASLMPKKPEIMIEECENEQKKVSFAAVTDFQEHFFYRSAINAFVYQIIDDIYHVTKKENRYAFICLTVLMPNVYNQTQLGDRMRDLHKDIRTIISDEPFKGVIGGVEVNSISESDASILGCMSVFPTDAVMLDKGNILIMDAGKGTLDISVLQYDPDPRGKQPYTSLYRSGIVGSGNAISYALFLDLMSMMLKELSNTYTNQALCEECLRNILRKLVVGGDEYLLKEMMMYIDHYKCLLARNVITHSPRNTEDKKEKKKLEETENIEKTEESKTPKISLERGIDLTLRSIVEWIKMLFSNPLNPLLSDSASLTGELSYMPRMINILADDAFRNFGFRGNIDYVVMSGRGFLLPQFKDAINERLSNWCKLKKNQIRGYPFQDVLKSSIQDSYNAKNVCLFALQNRMYDGRTVGKPEHIRQGEDPFLYKPGEPDNEKINKKKIGKSGKSILRLLFADYGGRNTVMSDDDFVKGMKITLKNRHDLIRISGAYYRIPDNASNGANATIYFNGTEFVFSCNGEVRHFAPATLPPVDHIFESLFPYGIIPDVIPLLDFQTRQNKTESTSDGNNRDTDNDFNDFVRKI